MSEGLEVEISTKTMPSLESIPDMPAPIESPMTTINPSKAYQIARKAGLKSLKPKTIKAFRRLGEFLEAEKIAYIQAGRIMNTSETLDQLAKFAEDIAQNSQDPRVKIEAIKAAVTALGEKNDADSMVQKMIENSTLKIDVNSRKFRSFDRGAVVNINTMGPVDVKDSSGGSV